MADLLHQGHGLGLRRNAQLTRQGRDAVIVLPARGAVVAQGSVTDDDVAVRRLGEGIQGHAAAGNVQCQGPRLLRYVCRGQTVQHLHMRARVAMTLFLKP